MTILSLDLDDTLYKEIDFVQSGFAEVATYLASKSGLSPSKVLFQLNLNLRRFGRGKVFDSTLTHFGIFSSSEVRRCLSIYREHQPKIRLSPKVVDVLSVLSEKLPLYLVTDGNRLVQRRKVAALGLDQFFRRIFYTRDFGLYSEKPSLTCFQRIIQEEKVNWKELMYVGDNPNKDFVSLRKVGAITVGTQDSPYSINALPSEFQPEWKIRTFTDLPILLQEFGWI